MGMKEFDKVIRKGVTRFALSFMLLCGTLYVAGKVITALVPWVPLIVGVIWLVIIGIVVYRRFRRW